jgi:hypothetical protein
MFPVGVNDMFSTILCPAISFVNLTGIRNHIHSCCQNTHKVNTSEINYSDQKPKVLLYSQRIRH